MYLEHFQLTHSPFREEPDPEVFFPGARREEVCQSLILDVLAGRPLVKLIGREGSGKTLICQVVIDRLPAEYKVVYIDNPAGAFDDLLRIACLDLGMNPSMKHDSVNFLEELRNLLEKRRAQKKKTVLIIDEAEKMFLATLERLVRHIGEQSDILGLTIILAGRPGLDANLEQLSAFCNNVDIQAGYFLEPLTESETRQYLRYRLHAAGVSHDQHDDIFTEGAVAKIFSSAQGNLRLINILAEESLQISCEEKSFMVLLDHVDPEASEDDKIENRVIEVYDLLRQNKLVAGALVAAAVLVLSIGILLSGKNGGKKAEVSRSGQSIQVIPPPQSPPPSTQAGTAGVVSQPAGQPEAQSDGSIQTNPLESPGTQSSETALSLPALSQEEAQRDGDKLFRERRGASATWLAGAYRGLYTIQLMMLSSEQAQAGITRMLMQDDYYKLHEQFYILRKKGNPPTFFVFYGIYDSMGTAREARNSMPVFLRKHHPYPLAISDALKKTED